MASSRRMRSSGLGESFGLLPLLFKLLPGGLELPLLICYGALLFLDSGPLFVDYTFLCLKFPLPEFGHILALGNPLVFVLPEVFYDLIACKGVGIDRPETSRGAAP